MKSSNKTRHSLISSVVSLVLCISMLLGSTFAWFTDVATTKVNVINAGKLKVLLLDEHDNNLEGKSLPFLKHEDAPDGEAILWEPGASYETQRFFVKNDGNLALQYKIAINGLDGNSKLLEAIEFSLEDENGNKANMNSFKKLLPDEKSTGYKLVGKMKESAGNEYQDLKLDGISITVYATQVEYEHDSYSNIYDVLADEAVFVTMTKTLAPGAKSIEFEMKYNDLTIAIVTVPADALADKSKSVTVTIDGIDPSDTISVGENVKAYAYDIEVSNLKENLAADKQVKVVLTTPNALPTAQVYHNSVLMANTTYDEVEGTITFTTDSFSPYAVTYTEIEVATLQELRDAVLQEDVYIKLAADIKVDFNNQTLNGVADTSVRDKDHSWTVSSYKNPEHTYYFIALVQGNVTIDLNGHEIYAIDRQDDGYMWGGSAITLARRASLNFTDTAGDGKMKVEGELTAIWSAYAHDTDWCDIYGGIFMRDSYVHAGDSWDECLIYGAHDNNDLGLINVYGGYFLFNNYAGNHSGRSGAFNIGDQAAFESIRIHDGVMLIDGRYRQTTGTDDDSIKLAEGCEIVKVTLDTPIVIDGVEYATWYQVQTTKPTFETVFENTENYLYRVGNSNTIKLGSLFQATNPNSAIADDAEIDVTIESMDSTTNVAGTYTTASTATNWANGTIKFTGTGVAKITINGCELLLEVVDGTNVTTASGLSNSASYILLNDISLTSGKTSMTVASGKTLFGNGFTIDYAGNGKHSSNTSGVITVSGGTIDNVKIIGDTYTTFTDSSTDEWYAAAVYATGTSKITNSYIHGCQVALRVQGTSCTVENTTLSGGRYANLQLKQGTLTLKDVTTVQEKVVVDGTACLGFGVVVWEDAPADTQIKVEGNLTQYNWVQKSDKSYLPGTAASYAEQAFNYEQFVYSYGGTNYVNLGIVSISSNVMSGAIEVPNGYSSQDVSGKACVVTCDRTADGTKLANGVPVYDGWGTSAQGEISPTYTWKYPSEYNSSSKQIVVSFTEGESYTINPNFLSATKHGASLDVAVSMDGTDYTGKEITFTQSGEHTLTYTVTDPYNYNAAAGKSSATYTFTIAVSSVATAPEAAHAEFTYTAGQAATVVEIGGKKYVMPNVSATSSTIYSTTVSGTTVYMPIVEVVYKDNTSDFNGYAPIFTAINIKDYAGGLPTGATTTYSKTSESVPTNWGKSSGSPYISGAASTTANPVTYSTYGLCYESKKGANISASAATVLFYYTDNAGETYYYYIRYSFPAHTCPSACFTPDTLITLANGSQKRVDEVKATDKIMAWDFFTGSYVAKDVSLLVNHGENLYAIANLKFDDGTLLKVIGEHGVFDYDLNKYVYITTENMSDYIGHHFVQYATDGTYKTVTLTEAYKTEEYTSAWSISSAETSNAFASGLLTVAPPEDFYNWIEMDGKLHYDVEQFVQDVETYGLYIYEDFKDYVTPEQFIAWNGAYLKIPVEKGYFTFEYILELIELYKGWMP